ncbi:MAG: hypothetical protein D4R67_07905 [Bacteroidetes bacterium]|nr:MAG: hypothetical protein D4R67_07905 [Bacteroidota bacterium]
MILNVFANPDGEYVPERPLGEMIKISEMYLTLGDFNMLNGNGIYVPYPIYPDIIHNTYTVQARKTNNIDFTKENLHQLKSGLGIAGWENDICKIIFSITSWIITSMTDGIVRTMSSDCWLHKDGGGYYAFGHEGPGSLFPILTQSIYYPFEWSACHVREYGFDIDIKGENISYEALKNSIINSPPVKDLVKKLGFTGIPELEQALDDFYDEFGGFGITVFYDTHTKNSGLYINHTKGDSEAAKNSVLAQSMKSAFEAFSDGVYVYAGSSIHDSWHLRRSPAFICNTPIIIFYVIGTHNVEYN